MAQPGRDRVGKIGPGCVATPLWAHGDSALGAHTTRPGRVHNKD